MGYKYYKFFILILLFLSSFCFSQIKQCVQNGGNYDCISAVLKYCPNGFSPDLRQCVEDPMSHCTKNWVERSDEEWGKLGFVAYSNPRFQPDDSSRPSSGWCISDARSLFTGEIFISNNARLGYPFTDCSSFPTHQTQFSDSSGFWCAKPIEFVAVLPASSLPPQCPVGNPIDPSTGAKIQKETDLLGSGSNKIYFERTYTNSNKKVGGYWNNNYGRSLSVIPDKYSAGVREQSEPQSTRSNACSSGWSEIRTRINDPWSEGAFSRWVEDKSRCEIVQNGRVVQQLQILIYPPFMRTVIPGYVQLTRDNGAILNFYQTGPDTYTDLNGTQGVLKRLGTTGKWQFITGSGDVENYNKEKLVSIVSSNGMKQELFYDATTELLSRVKDSTGRELLFAYTGNQISSVTVDGNKTTSYAYNSLGLMNKVTRPDNTTRIYHYEDSRFPTYLTGITDERGARYATWKYDAQGRAISSEHAGGAEKTLLAFNADGSTTVTNALNKKTIYHFADITGARRVVKVEGQPTANCAGANQDYTYTFEGWIASKTDWKGIKTTYQYNSLGQETSRTEAFGTPEARTTTTEWHPTLFVKTKITELGKQTVYNYDANARLLNQSTSVQ